MLEFQHYAEMTMPNRDRAALIFAFMMLAALIAWPLSRLS